MRLAYADPPYPGKADRYAENQEVDHAALVAMLCEYDGWALSTDERALRYVIGLCPEGTRVLAWCRPNVAPFPPYPFAAWEPVLCVPARPRHDSVRSYAEITTVGGRMARENYRGQKPRGFCEWVLRCLGATSGDTMDDLFPGSGVMGETFEWFSRQTTLTIPKANRAAGARAEANRLRRTHDPLPGFDSPGSVPEGADFYQLPSSGSHGSSAGAASGYRPEAVPAAISPIKEHIHPPPHPHIDRGSRPRHPRTGSNHE